jgi:hypothetical protein
MVSSLSSSLPPSPNPVVGFFLSHRRLAGRLPPSPSWPTTPRQPSSPLPPARHSGGVARPPLAPADVSAQLSGVAATFTLAQLSGVPAIPTPPPLLPQICASLHSSFSLGTLITRGASASILSHTTSLSLAKFFSMRTSFLLVAPPHLLTSTLSSMLILLMPLLLPYSRSRRPLPLHACHYRPLPRHARPCLSDHLRITSPIPCASTSDMCAPSVPFIAVSLVYHPVAIHHDPHHVHPMVMRRSAGVLCLVGRLVLTTATATPPSYVPSPVRSALVDPHWCRAMEEEYEALMANYTSDLVLCPLTPTWPRGHRQVSLQSKAQGR